MPALRSVAAVVLVAALLGNPTAQNSTRKVRPAPSAAAARVGSAVAWRADLDAALAEAREVHKPVLWYVPTISGSPMDRKPEIDRYMMAGPFSWPSTVGVANELFVPVRQVASVADRQRFDLQPVAFIEPGLLVLDGHGRERARLDQITTLDPAWFLARLGAALPDDVRSGERFAALKKAVGDPVHAAAFARGALAFVDRREDEARELWRELVRLAPDDPWSWKAAAEAEGFGPIVHGFERVGVELPARVLAPHDGRGTLAPTGSWDVDEVRRAGLEFLAAMQRSHGGFEDSIYDFGGTDGLPNVWVAVTAIVATATLETLPHVPADERARFEPMLAAAIDYVLDPQRINMDDRDERVWAHLYAVRLLCRALARRPETEERLRPALADAVAALCAMQPDDGAWYHEYPNPFVIGSCLVALREAERAGIAVPPLVVERGIKALLACRASDGAISYGFVRRGPARAQIAAGVGRMPLAEHALAAFGHGEDGALERALAASFRHHDELAVVRKYDDHASRLGYGGFFFWYGVHVRHEAILALPNGEARDRLLRMQRELILSLPEIDGCFVDSHELGRSYGTAMALWCLVDA
jgi:hypothetical protein